MQRSEQEIARLDQWYACVKTLEVEMAASEPRTQGVLDVCTSLELMGIEIDYGS